jgi:hypothetical protein
VRRENRYRCYPRFETGRATRLITPSTICLSSSGTAETTRDDLPDSGFVVYCSPEFYDVIEVIDRDHPDKCDAKSGNAEL